MNYSDHARTANSIGLGTTDPPGKRKVANYIIATIVILNFGVSLLLSLILNVWIDEAFTLNDTGGSLTFAVKQALNFELQPPLYFVLLNLWRMVNSSLFFARVFSGVCIATTLVVAAMLGRRFFTGAAQIWSLLIIAFNPFTIWAATEIRFYPLVILFSSLLILFFYDGYISEIPSRRARLLYLIVAVLSLYTQSLLSKII